jgi:hypothetical protein
MNAIDLQVSFFKRLKENLPKHVSLAEEVSEKLNISNDSAYRRIRGEKALTFDEIGTLCSVFRISLDQFFNIDKGTDNLIFSGKFISREKADIQGYLEGLVQQLQYFNSFADKEIIYLNKDVPIFYSFMFPELAAFKCYFWSRYNLNYPEFSRGHFLMGSFSEVFKSTGKKIVDLYLQIPSTEVWNLDSISLTLHQINYCTECKIFESKDDIRTVYDSLEKLIAHIESQVEAGVKFPYGKNGNSSTVKYRAFINEFMQGDNTVLIRLDNNRIVSLNHNFINYIMTRDEKFVDYTYQTIQTLLKKSTLISEVGERDRNLFFDSLRERIHNKRKLL